MIPVNFSIEKARLAQKKIAEKVVERDEIELPLRLAAGVDVAYKNDKAFAAGVVVDVQTLSPVEVSVTEVEVKFPYIPTLLAFREVWPAFKALKKLRSTYQVLFVDGNGRLHPYKAGFACHLGVVVGKPTIGVAKKLLMGSVERLSDKLGMVIYNGEVLAYAVKLGRSRRDIYISVGNKLTLNTALKLAISLTKSNASLPEPIRLAHIYATSARKRNS
ncbi:hypothetical protein MA03_06025 [Infirmifilum uzonense]|uniref:Endonuclease V n=1 Tax=Infirmifilum uzonense TaxID=1550241 RepID=A0A0F7FJ62_9CREN|nr:endonuclease V [Infirmifilum uzonense]AKG38900.1 hypothetical protein MA03_06025 [Infirmifilum uzonense]